MAQQAVAGRGVSIRLACHAFVGTGTESGNQAKKAFKAPQTRPAQRADADQSARVDGLKDYLGADHFIVEFYRLRTREDYPIAELFKDLVDQ